MTSPSRLRSRGEAGTTLRVETKPESLIGFGFMHKSSVPERA